MTRIYREAVAETLDILDHTSKEKVKLIPLTFINFLRENVEKDYVVNLDYSKPINEMNIKKETMGILGTICRNWWWSEDEKREYVRLVREKEIRREQELRKKYNPDDVFKNRKQTIIEDKSIKNTNNQVTETAMIEKKENIFSKMLKAIKGIFSKE